MKNIAMRALFLRVATLALLTLTVSCSSASRGRSSGPWDLESLYRPVEPTWGKTNGRVQEVYYPGEPLDGKPTRVFGYYARPTGSRGARLPGMVLVHGGGGKAFSAWAEHWADRGYAALAMDLAGNGPESRLPDGAPDQSDAVKFRDFEKEGYREMWSYHAVAAVIRAHSLLRNLPEVDPDRIGVTGISWGGYLTCVVAGLDGRFKVAVPVYGCGYLGDNSVWKDHALASMNPKARKLWLELFDPARYLRSVTCPILFMNGTTDFAYPLDSYQRSYLQVPETLRSLCVVTNLPHGHIWTFPEVDAFVDHALVGSPASPKLGQTMVNGRELAASVTSPLPVREATLCYTTHTGPWQKREWSGLPARIRGERVEASLPSDDVKVAFFLIRDSRGLRASSEHVEFKP